MDFNLPTELTEFLRNLDRFIDQEIKPLQAQDDNERFFDHRREWARTDFDNSGLPRPEWEALLQQCKKVADKAGFYRLSLPKEFGGQAIGNLWMSVIRDHLASKGLGCAGMRDWFDSGRDATVERAMIARRVSENELELLRLLSQETADA